MNVIIISYFLQKMCGKKTSSPVCCLLPSFKLIVHFRFQLQFPNEGHKRHKIIIIIIIIIIIKKNCNHSDRAVSGVRLQPLAGIVGSKPSMDMDACLLLSVVCCQVEVSTSGWSPVQRSPTEGGVSQCDRGASTMTKPWPNRGCRATGRGGGINR